MIYIGIDPGKTGGIAYLDDAGTCIAAVKMPFSERDLFDLLVDVGKLSIDSATGNVNIRAMVEQVGVMPKQGIVSAFTFGKGVGAIRMALVASEIPFDEVLPAKWQLVLGCRSKGDKNVTKRRAQQLFPRVPVTHALADALLIAEYCRRMDKGSYGEKESVAQAHTQATRKSNPAAGQQSQRQRQIARRVEQARSSIRAREISAAESRTAVSGFARHGAKAQRPAR